MKRLNKLLSILLALAMLLSLTVSVAADSYTITVTNATSGETYKAYKIFDASTDGNGGYSYTISESNPFYSAISSAASTGTLKTYLTLTASNVEKVYTVEFTESASNDEDKIKAYNEAFTAALIKVIKGVLSTTAVIESGSKTADSTTAEISVNELGYYYVTTTVGTVVSLDTTESTNVNVKDKNSVPSVTKEVYEGTATTDDDVVANTNDANWDKDSDAAIGDVVYFKTTINNIYGVNKLLLHDALDDGLTFGSVVSVKLYASDQDSGTELTSYETNNTTYDYKVLTGNDLSDTRTGQSSWSCDFEIDFSSLYSGTNAPTTTTACIEVVYTATVNSSAKIYDDDSNGNTTYVTYGDASYTNVDNTQTYVYEVTLYKYTLGTGTVDSQYSTLTGSTPLANASFVIMNSEGKYAKFTTADNVTYTLDSWVDSDYTTLTTGSTGYLYLKGLDAETVYTIHETAAPSGYNALSSDITFVIAGSDSTGSRVQGSVYANTTSETTITYTVKADAGSTGTTALAIENKSGSEMPSTGGMGTTIFYMVGGVLVVGAVILLITKRRLSNSER